MIRHLGSKENSPSGEEEENLCAEPSLEHVFFFFSLDGLVTLWLSRARVCLEAVTMNYKSKGIVFVVHWSLTSKHVTKPVFTIFIYY